MGKGLGLPLAKKVAVRAGGDIELISEPGRGTTAVLVLGATKRDTARAGRPGVRERSAAISIRNYRVAALITQVLIGVGVQVRPAKRDNPGKSDLWVTHPTPSALVAAARWRKGHPERAVIVFGAPQKSARDRWTALGATIIDPPDDFEAIRHAVGEATGRWNSSGKGGANGSFERPVGRR
jgi:hypothetical protein